MYECVCACVSELVFVTVSVGKYRFAPTHVSLPIYSNSSHTMPQSHKMYGLRAVHAGFV